MKTNYTLLVLLLALSIVPVANAIGTGPAIETDMVLYYKMNNNSAIGENSTLLVTAVHTKTTQQ